MNVCSYCFFSEKYEKALAFARQWEEQKLPSLSAPWKKAAREFEVLASHYKKCNCHEHKEKKVKKSKKATVFEWP